MLPVAAGAPKPVVAGLAPNPVEVEPNSPPPVAGAALLEAPNPVDPPKVDPVQCNTKGVEFSGGLSEQERG